MKFILLLIVAVFSAHASPSLGAEELTLSSLLPKTHEIWVSRDFEDGVANRMLTDYFGRYWLSPVFALDVGLGLSFFDQTGVDLVGVAGVANFPNAHSFVALGIEHEQWPSWQVTENRLELYWNFHPIEVLTATFGLGYRVPQFGSTTIAQALSWTGPEGEISVLYRFDWRVAQIEKLGLTFMLWDYDHMELYTGDNVHFSVKLDYPISEKWRLMAMAGIAAKGVSGGILSWGQNQLALGASYGN